jgi:LEA14-like dessication related protein
MKAIWIVGTLVVGGVVYAVIKSAKNLDTLEIGVSSVDYDSKASKLTQFARFKMKISVYNPNSRPVKFKQFTGNMYYKGERIANIDPVTSKTITFPARSNSTIPIQVDIPTPKIASGFLDLIEQIIAKKTKSISKVVTLKGSLQAENLTIPISYDLSLTQI